MLSLSSVQNVDSFVWIMEAITEAVNSLPPVYSTEFPWLPTAASVVSQCHPLMMQTYKPVLTTGGWERFSGYMQLCSIGMS